jgi:hypothetical protein
MREHLPRLLAVSLTLSSRFEHDPSPYGVADAFLGMQRELVEELSVWASEMGGFMSMGLGAMVGNAAGTGLPMPMAILADGIGKRSKSTSEMGSLLDQEERLGLGDIVSLRISRIEQNLADQLSTDHHAYSEGVAIQAPLPRAREQDHSELQHPRQSPRSAARRRSPRGGMRSAPDIPPRGDTTVRPKRRFVLYAGSTFGPGDGDGNRDGGEIKIEVETRVHHGSLFNWGLGTGSGIRLGLGVQRFVLLPISP